VKDPDRRQMEGRQSDKLPSSVRPKLHLLRFDVDLLYKTTVCTANPCVYDTLNSISNRRPSTNPHSILTCRDAMQLVVRPVVQQIQATNRTGAHGVWALIWRAVSGCVWRQPRDDVTRQRQGEQSFHTTTAAVVTPWPPVS